ncbi:hypothetical protein ACQ4PT_063899 [Festuca glaucescens]
MGIDLNTVEQDGEAMAAAVSAELWHACAGAGVALPRRGSKVVYLPQAHLAAGGCGGEAPLGAGHVPVPPHVVCRVVGVDLCADVATDEVYARLALVAEGEVSTASSISCTQLLGVGVHVDVVIVGNKVKCLSLTCKALKLFFLWVLMFKQDYREGGTEEGAGEREDGDGEKKPRMPHMFCKTLTASDTSTHGGFSVPRRAAEDCFPPLDYKQVRPSQELVAKDLHGTQWRFRHIYRASELSDSSFSSFRRSGASEFIVPYWRFSKNLNHPFSIGMRFKVSNDSDDANERSTGLISGISEIDPIRWPGSKWRCLMVIWDDTRCNHQRRVSPWEIERVGGSISVTDYLPASSSKRTKLYFPQGNLDAPVTDGNGCLDSVENRNFHRVLQGQELLMGSRTQGVGRSQSPDVTKFRTPDPRRFSANARNCMSHGLANGLSQNTEFPYQSSGFGESVRFLEVLQGQEMSQAVPFYQGTPFDARGSFGYVQRSAAPSGLSSGTQGYALGQFTPSAAKVSSPSSVLMFNQAAVPQFELEGRTNYRGVHGSQCATAPLELVREMETWPPTQRQTPSEIGCRRFDTGNASAPLNIVESRSATATGDIGRSSCRLFGFSLTDDKIQGAGEDGVKEGSSIEEADRADPRVLDLFGYTHRTPSALHALVAAPLGM